MPLEARVSQVEDLKSKVITVVVTFELTCVILCLFTRLSIRWPWRKFLGRNDVMALISTIFAIANAAAISVAVGNGLGAEMGTVSNVDMNTVRKAFLAGQILFYLCSSFASLAVVEFLFNLKGTVGMSVLDHLLQGLRIFTCVWGLAGLVTMAAFLALDAAAAKAAAWIVLGIFGCIIQLATLVAAALLIIPLETDKLTKTRALLGFSPSFLVIAAFIVSMSVMPTSPFEGGFTTTIVPFAICSQLVLLFLILYATTPTLFQMGKKLRTGFNAPIIGTNSSLSGSRTAGGKNGTINSSYALKSITTTQVKISSAGLGEHRPQNHHDLRRPSQTTGESDQDGGESMNSDSSQRIIIRKTVEQHSDQM